MADKRRDPAKQQLTFDTKCCNQSIVRSCSLKFRFSVFCFSTDGKIFVYAFIAAPFGLSDNYVMKL